MLICDGTSVLNISTSSARHDMSMWQLYDTSVTSIFQRSLEYNGRAYRKCIQALKMPMINFLMFFSTNYVFSQILFAFSNKGEGRQLELIFQLFCKRCYNFRLSLNFSEIKRNRCSIKISLSPFFALIKPLSGFFLLKFCQYD